MGYSGAAHRCYHIFIGNWYSITTRVDSVLWDAYKLEYQNLQIIKKKMGDRILPPSKTMAPICCRSSQRLPLGRMSILL